MANERRTQGQAARVRKRLFVALLATWLAIPGLVNAHHLDVRDGNDVDGVLDIRRVAIYGHPPTWSIVTRGRWRARSIWDRGFMLVAFNTFGSARYDYYALIRSTGRRLRADLYRDRARKRDYKVSSLKTWRPDRRSVKVRVPLDKMSFGSKRSYYRWFAQSLLTGPDCRRTCIDLAPDRSGVREPLEPPPDSHAAPLRSN
jgi:hypothetical protein